MDLCSRINWARMSDRDPLLQGRQCSRFQMVVCQPQGGREEGGWNKKKDVPVIKCGQRIEIIHSRQYQFENFLRNWNCLYNPGKRERGKEAPSNACLRNKADGKNWCPRNNCPLSYPKGVASFWGESSKWDGGQKPLVEVDFTGEIF